MIRGALAPHELTHTQFVLLTSLWWASNHHERTPTQRELAELAGTDPMVTSQIVRKLAQRGLITRSADAQDARARRLQITSAGIELVTAAVRDVERTDTKFFESISSTTQREALLDGLRTLAQLTNASEAGTTPDRSGVSHRETPADVPHLPR